MVLAALLSVFNNFFLSPQIDAAVRAALLPRLAEPGPTGATEVTLPSSSLSFSSIIPDSYSGHNVPAADLNESPISVTALRPSALVKIQEFLLRGERRQAYHFALDEKLWAHAMIIASSIDKEAWKEVINEFLRSELGPTSDSSRLPAFPRNSEAASMSMNGREWLRVAYSLFSGQGPAAGEYTYQLLTIVQYLIVINSSRIAIAQPTVKGDRRPAIAYSCRFSYYTYVSKFPSASHHIQHSGGVAIQMARNCRSYGL